MTDARPDPTQSLPPTDVNPTTRTAPPPEPPGPVLAGRYHLIGQLGEGGMGSVWLARDAELGRDVAVKMLPAERLNSTDTVKRFRREAQALARLSHPNIVQAFDVGEHDGRPFFVMEYVPGANLADRLKAGGPLPPTRAADVGHQVALALAYAHAAGLVHRDVKPGNLILTPDGRVKLLDLGLARFQQDHLADGTRTREGAGMGTPDYSAPEQFRDARTADARSDVYALGCTLYHLIGGRVPFPGSSLAEKLAAHETAEPASLEALAPDVPLGLALAVRRMMAKRPADRFQTAAEAADALAPYVAGGASTVDVFRHTAQWDGSQIRSRTTRRRPRWASAVAGLAAGLLVAILGVAAGQRAGWVRFGDTPEVARAGQPEPPVEPKEGEPTPPQPDPPKPAVPDDPDVLTVSQKPEGGGKYQTINAALEAVKPGQTIRVLDDREYAESVRLFNRERFAGVTLEGPRRATLRGANAKGVVQIYDVPGVTVRGFRFRIDGQIVFAVGLTGDATGTVLEDLDVVAEGAGVSYGIDLVHLTGPAPVVVRGCRLAGLRIGVRVSGIENDFKTTRPCRGVRLLHNRIENCQAGLFVTGDVQHLHATANVFRRSLITGVQFNGLLGRPQNLLIANNTFDGSAQPLTVYANASARPPFDGVAFRNNLILKPGGRDALFTDLGEEPLSAGRPGDGAALGREMRIGHNWRAVRPAEDWPAKGWIPAAKTDTLGEPEGLDTEPGSPRYLRPAKDSPLATQGAGNDDPTLPRYVGAVPPEGEYPWDWDRTWRMPPDAQLLTVSKDEKDGGKYRTINDALNDAKPWATIRVLDAAVYAETAGFTLDRHTGITLEAVKRATLAPTDNRFAVVVRAVPWVTVRGFRLSAEVGNQIPAGVTGACPGVLLDDLEVVAGKARPAIGICLEHVHLPDDAPPVVVRGCRLVRPLVGIQVGGLDADYRTRRTSSRVVVRGNRVESPAGGINLVGDLHDVLVVGNVVTGGSQGGIQLENLFDTTRDVLVANNTVSQCEDPLRLWDDKAKGVLGTRIRFRNNLLLDTIGAEVIYKDAVNAVMPRGHGDGRAVADRWQFDHNWRESAAPPDAQGLVPPGATDVRRPRIEGVERDPKSPSFLRPAKDSPLATGGAGTDDPTLPKYVGAVPPEGVEPWDWGRTWRWKMAGTPRPSETAKDPEKKP